MLNKKWLSTWLDINASSQIWLLACKFLMINAQTAVAGESDELDEMRTGNEDRVKDPLIRGEPSLVKPAEIHPVPPGSPVGDQGIYGLTN